VLKAREAADYLRISLFTLSKIERQGLLTPMRTPGGHRRYTLEMLNQYLEASRRPVDRDVTPVGRRTWPRQAVPDRSYERVVE
jgi:excisionase family DNA binding protein